MNDTNKPNRFDLLLCQTGLAGLAYEKVGERLGQSRAGDNVDLDLRGFEGLRLR